MKYTVSSPHGDEYTFEKDGEGVTIDNQYYFDRESFKEFRRAVGLVWQDIEND